MKMTDVDRTATDRWRERAAERAASSDAIAHGRLAPVNRTTLLDERLSRLTAVHHLREATLERIIGGDELLCSTYLARGAQATKAVGRIVIGDNEGYGTGFLVAPRVLMTNNHVLPTADQTRRSTVQFGYEERDDGSVRPTTYELAPDELFISSKALDYTLVAVAGPKEPGRRLGYLPLIEASGKALVGEWLNIVQHPEGQTKRIAIRENRLSDELPKFLHYEADTNPGSSGSPVLNDQWEVVALHHSGVPSVDDQGRYLKADGSLWTDADGISAVAWVANEGVRASVIVKDLKKRRTRLNGSGNPLLDSVLSAGEQA